ncbi:HAD family hydrolase [Chryseolinea sp. T2]|uniref:HAD family hydrolase n=1 Tax=Chryseolinea sp. T2 TaxID=3129255 RepID=UPI0030773418
MSMTGKSDILIILDLDETLVYSTENRLDTAEDSQYEKYFIYKRPGLDNFLRQVSEHFRIGIWSSAGDIYVAEVVNNIVPIDVQLEIVWSRSKCTQRKDFEQDIYYWEKRLDKLKKKGFRIEKIIIVDDSPEKARDNFGNAVYVKEFNGEPGDRELEVLFDYLLTLKRVDNVRAIEKRGWRERAHKTS